MFRNLLMSRIILGNNFFLFFAICPFCAFRKAAYSPHFVYVAHFSILMSGASIFLISSVNIRGCFGKMGKKTCVKRQALQGGYIYVVRRSQGVALG